MSKFLKLVEENRPLTSQELDKVTPIKRIIQRALLSDVNKAILDDIGLQKVEVTQNSNNITLKFKDNTILTYILELAKEEETEDAVLRAGETIAASDPEKRKPVTQELNKYKTTVKSVETKVADNLRKLNLSLAAIQKDLR